MPMAVVAALARISRPARRRVTPGRFKETYVARELDRRVQQTTYVEIGVRDGESLRIVKADRKIAVDPIRTPRMSVLRAGEEFFEVGSDEFFDHHAPKALAPRSVDVALVDGLHEFRQVLRDVLNLERYMRRDGVIFLDDANPRTPARARDTPTGGAWNGDVWKVAPFLTSERPDLEFFTIDADEGIGVLRGFGVDAPWPTSETVRRFKDLSYDVLARARAETLKLVRPSAVPASATE